MTHCNSVRTLRDIQTPVSAHYEAPKAPCRHEMPIASMAFAPSQVHGSGIGRMTHLKRL